MCDYCNPNKVNYLFSNFNIEFYIVKSIEGGYFLGAEYNSCGDELSFPIKYCPSCGRNLSEEKEELEKKYMCCKWCEHCINTNLRDNEGYCYLDIGEYISDTENCHCDEFRYDEDLGRC